VPQILAVKLKAFEVGLCRMELHTDKVSGYLACETPEVSVAGQRQKLLFM
jgi:hypothetical protein